MALKIYTKTGDKGETSLFGGKRVLKSSLRVETYGTVDELNSILGICVATSKNKQVKKELKQIQNDLFDIGSVLATPPPTDSKKTEFLVERVEEFEKLIDSLTEQLPELKNFILPGGTSASSHVHLARSVCRRCERRIVELSQTEEVAPEIKRYFNRLSDLLFTVARFENKIAKKKDILWVKNG